MQAFYKQSRPIVAFKVQDEHTKRSFFYVTNVAMREPDDKIDDPFKIWIRKTSSKPDIVSNQMAKDIQVMTEVKNMRDLSV